MGDGYLMSLLLAILILQSRRFVVRADKMTMAATLEKCTSPQGLLACPQKLTISLKIENNDEPLTDEKVVKIDRALDLDLKEDVLFTNSVVVKLRQEQVMVVHPVRKVAVVNNKAYEVVLSRATMPEYSGCDEESLPFLCGYAQRDRLDIRPQARGFCCACASEHPKTATKAARRNDCGKINSDDSFYASAHCMKYDPIWYTVYELLPPFLDHTVHFSIHESIGSDWLQDGGKVLVAGSKIAPSFSDDNRVFVEYIGLDFNRTGFSMDFSRKYLLVPNADSSSPSKRVAQIKRGSQEYLLLDKNLVDLKGDTMDKIGVSPKTFVNQGDVCNRPTQSGLKNQPMHFWLEDTVKTFYNYSTSYFLGGWATLNDRPLVHNVKTGKTFLRTVYTSHHTSTMNVQVNADRLGPLYKGTRAQITSVVTLWTINRTALVYCDVTNLDQVSSYFIVQLNQCTLRNFTKIQKSLLMSPNKSTRLRMETIAPNIQDGVCQLEILGHGNRNVATRKVLFNAELPCVCEGYCGCRCGWKTGSGYLCEPLSDSEFYGAGYSGHRLSPVLFVEDHNNLELDIIGAGIVFLFIFLTLLKAFVGLCSSEIGTMGLCLFARRRRLNDYYEKHLFGYDVIYDEAGRPIHPITRGKVRFLSKGAEFALNLIIFLYLPFIWLHWLWLCITSMGTQKSNDKKATKYQVTQTSPSLFKRLSVMVEKVNPLSKEEVLEQYRQHKSVLSTNRSCTPTLQEETGNEIESETEYEQIEHEYETFSTMSSSPQMSAKYESTPSSGKPVRPSVVAELLPSPIGNKQEPYQMYVDLTPRSTPRPSPTQIYVNLSPRPHGTLLARKSPYSSPRNKQGVDSPVSSPRRSLFPARSPRPSVDDSIQSALQWTALNETTLNEIRRLCCSGRTVYMNFTAKDFTLHNSGKKFSLAGKLRTVRSSTYEFYVDQYNTQLFQNVDSFREELMEPVPMNVEHWRRILEAPDVLRHVSETPLYPCLNKVLLQETDSNDSFYGESSQSFFMS